MFVALEIPVALVQNEDEGGGFVGDLVPGTGSSSTESFTSPHLYFHVVLLMFRVRQTPLPDDPTHRRESLIARSLHLRREGYFKQLTQERERERAGERERDLVSAP